MSEVRLSQSDQEFGAGRTFWVTAESESFPATHDLIIRADCEIIVDGMFLQSDAEKVSWEIFAFPTFNEGEGEIALTSQRRKAAYEVKATAWANPTITDKGASAMPNGARTILGQVAPGERSFINHDIFEGKQGSIPAGFTYLFRFIRVDGLGDSIYFTLYCSEPECNK